jgi:uncharacterized protein
MTPDERSLLQQFLYDLGQTRGVTKDQEADVMIAQTLRSNSDATYLLVQHAVLADQALQAAQMQIAQMEQQLGPQSSAPGGFFDPGPSGDQEGYPPGQQPLQAQSPLSPNGGLGSFLRTAGTMAAGVAGGEFLAKGISNLFAPRDW